MPDFLAVRDHDRMKTLELRELTKEEDANFEAFYAQMARKYPAPKFDLTIGGARSLDEFLKVYPRYAQQQPTGGGGGDGASGNAAGR